ncbi:hypothetical protein [Chitinophaga polysaccharea]|uniref:hypothetical protein n=1 Tax=Chitinophaga polysaccharea TaxID=1293035 RepID=UPI00115AA169|nr:hypothetical protein [Chitinophaga polysaccharea]
MKTKYLIALATLIFIIKPYSLYAQNKLLDDQKDKLTRFFYKQVPMSPSFVKNGKSAIYALLITVNPNGKLSSIKLSENTPEEFKNDLLKLKQADIKWSAFLHGRPAGKTYNLLLTIYTIINADYLAFAASRNGFQPSWYFEQIYNFGDTKYDLSSAIFIGPIFKSASNQIIEEHQLLDSNDIRE